MRRSAQGSARMGIRESADGASPGSGIQCGLLTAWQSKARMLRTTMSTSGTNAEPRAPAPELFERLTADLAVGAELRALLARLLAQEREGVRASALAQQQTMAAEIHDSVAQTLAYVKMRMPLLQAAITGHDEAQALKYCADVRQAVSGAHINLRGILGQLRAPMDPRGLKFALSTSIGAFRESTQVDLTFDDRAPGLQLSAQQESQVFRIVQEALANIAKHAGAKHAWLGIEASDGRVNVVIEDDGAGLPAAALQGAPSHFGLEIMHQRAARLGGGIEFGARSGGGGTRVRLQFPVVEPGKAR
jgi:two-component system, NarL family, nitrate/nitrite sensor histidine kinase NarX